MPTITLDSKDYDVLGPRRRIFLSEIGAVLGGDLWLRARAALLGLACPGIWATRKGPQPRYAGDVSVYGEEVFEHLAGMGIDADQVAAAGNDVWGHWCLMVKGPTSAEVKEAQDFTPAGEAPKPASTGASS